MNTSPNSPYSGYIVLDIETTGFDPNVDDAIEFAAIKLDASGTKIGELDILLSTKQSISPLVQSLTGISPQMIASSPHLDEVKSQIEDFVGNLPIVGHNISFDVDFLTAKGVNLPGDCLDTLTLSQTILPAQPGYSLEQLSHRLGFANQPSHRAMNDVLATADLFLALIGMVTDFKGDTNQQISQILDGQEWEWGWLWKTELNFNSVATNHETPSEYTDYLNHQLKAEADYLPQLDTAITGHINLIETHLGVDTVAQAISLAQHRSPALLVVPNGLIRQVKWDQLSTGVLQVVSEVSHLTLDDTPLNIVRSAADITVSTLKTAIKLTIWKQEYNSQPQALFFTSDERYEWEQNFITSQATINFALKPEGVWVVPAETLTTITNLQDFSIITSHPHNLEEAFFNTQIRTFSIPYFNASISARRDFVHREVAPKDSKAGDDLFKILSQIGPKFNRVAEIMSQVYFDNPPTNVYEKDIELTRAIVPSELEEVLGAIADLFTQYLTRLTEFGISDDHHQIERTQKLIDHLKALRQFEPSFKYFLFAESTKFYLQIIPDFTTFTQIHEIFTAAKSVIVVSAGLAYKKTFEYWKNLFTDASAKLIIDPTKTKTIMMPNDINPADNLEDLVRIVETSLEQNRRLLIVHGSAFDSRMLFDDLHQRLPQLASQISSLDTIGHADKLPDILPVNTAHVLVVPMFWLERAAASLSTFDTVVLSKLAFESSNKPIAKLYRGDSTSFGAYTLPKTTLRLKENLDYLAHTHAPIVFLDPRLIQKDYGRDITSSLAGWELAPTNFSDTLNKL
ncbi:MAG: 3'-5' exonuclease [Patescibacteria group bacterium]